MIYKCAEHRFLDIAMAEPLLVKNLEIFSNGL